MSGSGLIRDTGSLHPRQLAQECARRSGLTAVKILPTLSSRITGAAFETRRQRVIAQLAKAPGIGDFRFFCVCHFMNGELGGACRHGTGARSPMTHCTPAAGTRLAFRGSDRIKLPAASILFTDPPRSCGQRYAARQSKQLDWSPVVALHQARNQSRSAAQASFSPPSPSPVIEHIADACSLTTSPSVCTLFGGSQPSRFHRLRSPVYMCPPV